MSAESGGGDKFAVIFDEEAWEEDTKSARKKAVPRGKKRQSKHAETLREVERARERLERDGISLDELEECDAEARDGTSLPGCYKLRLPPKDERGSFKFRMIFQLTADETFLFLAYGVGHQPSRIGALDAYKRADKRLNGA